MPHAALSARILAGHRGRRNGVNRNRQRHLECGNNNERNIVPDFNRPLGTSVQGPALSTGRSGATPDRWRAVHSGRFAACECARHLSASRNRSFGFFGYPVSRFATHRPRREPFVVSAASSHKYHLSRISQSFDLIRRRSPWQWVRPRLRRFVRRLFRNRRLSARFRMSLAILPLR